MDTQLAKKTGSHYTSANLSEFMCKKLAHYFKEINGFNNEEIYKVLDPSCGEGELLFSLKEVLNKENLNYKLLGMDTNEDVIRKATSRFSENYELIVGDYLEQFSNVEETLFTINNAKSPVEPVDMIIANPPYVRTQVLGADKAQNLGEKFGLKGRVDLYQVFLVAMTQQLKEDGLICVITSNRYLTTTGGKDIRKFLNENYDILEVIDLGDTKLFDAAVLPAIFIGRKKRQDELKVNKEVPFIRIYEELDTKIPNENFKLEESVFSILNTSESGLYKIGDTKKYKITFGFLTIPEDSKELWIMASNEDKEWSRNLKSKSYCKFSDLFKVRVGIKSTADAVFINSAEFWSNLEDDMKPEDELLFPLISSNNIRKWNLESQLVEQTKILYTHKSVNGKKQAINLEEYKHAKNYLLSHHERLAGRSYLAKSKTRHWYEIWVPQDPLAFSKLKVIFPDISPNPKFTIDDKGYLVDGNCYWLTPISDKYIDYLYLACAVGNSSIMKRYHEIEFQNVLYSGRKRYLTQYVENYLMPDLNCEESKKIIELVKKIVGTNDSNEIVRLEKDIEDLLIKAFKLDNY